MISAKEGTLSWKPGLWGASGVLLSFAVGIKLGLRLKAGKNRRLAEKGITANPWLTAKETSSVDENLPVKTHTPLDDRMPLHDLPAITCNACIPTPELEIPQPASIADVVIEPDSAPVAQIAHLANSASTLLPTSQVVHEIGEPEDKLCNKLFPTFTAIWRRFRQGVRPRQYKKRLRVCETVSLGEKRFVAVIQVDGERFLVGGSSSSISTLAHLDKPREFSEVFGNRYQQEFSQA